MREIIADLDMYYIHEDTESGDLFGIHKDVYIEIIKPLQKKLGYDLKTYPDDINIKCFPLMKQGNEEKYIINLDLELELRLNKLYGIWIELQP